MYYYYLYLPYLRFWIYRDHLLLRLGQPPPRRLRWIQVWEFLRPKATCQSPRTRTLRPPRSVLVADSYLRWYVPTFFDLFDAWVDLKNKIQEIDKVKRNWWDMFTFYQIANSAFWFLEKELNDQTTSKTLLNDAGDRPRPFCSCVQGVPFGCLIISKGEILNGKLV